MNKNFLKTTTILCGIISAPLILLADSWDYNSESDTEGKSLVVNDKTIVSAKNYDGATHVTGARGNTVSIDNEGDSQSVVITKDGGDATTIVSKEVDGGTTNIVVTPPAAKRIRSR